MAVATLQLNVSNYPNGLDITQIRQNAYGAVTIIGSSPSYVQGGIRLNFNPLTVINAANLLPLWLELVSRTASGYIYSYSREGPIITNLALTSNVVTITAKNNLATGDTVKLSGLTTTAALNGTILTVLAGSLSATQFTANLTHGNISTAAETGNASPQTYATALPFQGNIQILQSAGSAAPLAELSTASLPAGVTADLIRFRAEFLRQ